MYTHDIYILIFTCLCLFLPEISLAGITINLSLYVCTCTYMYVHTCVCTVLAKKLETLWPFHRRQCIGEIRVQGAYGRNFCPYCNVSAVRQPSSDTAMSIEMSSHQYASTCVCTINLKVLCVKVNTEWVHAFSSVSSFF
jgi:hypothetical protein